ncbi:MAG: polyprenyl synthetase family protein [Candidatus Cryptobacteroides sp.]
MSRELIIRHLGSDWARMSDYIRRALNSDVPLLNSVNDTVLSHSGKMLRPMVTLLLARACGTPGEDTFRYAAALELLHNATLMHDDVADSSSERRGLPTVSALLGPSAAVLVGDFWLSAAVQLVLESDSFQYVVKLFSNSLKDLAEGEMVQMEKASKADTDEKDYLKIITCKTATLFRTAGEVAAHSVNAPEDYAEAARRYGLSLGIAFQIKDDILDYTGTDELGKPTGVDLKEKKITLPLLGALKESARDGEIRSMILNLDGHSEYIEEIRNFVLRNKGIEYAENMLDYYVNDAISALDPLPASPDKDYLVQIARFNALRNI